MYTRLSKYSKTTFLEKLLARRGFEYKEEVSMVEIGGYHSLVAMLKTTLERDDYQYAYKLTTDYNLFISNKEDRDMDSSVTTESNLLITVRRPSAVVMVAMLFGAPIHVYFDCIDLKTNEEHYLTSTHKLVEVLKKLRRSTDKSRIRQMAWSHHSCGAPVSGSIGYFLGDFQGKLA